MITAAFLCAMIAPAYVHDGDSIRCADGARIRIAGVQSPDYENTDPCRKHRAGYVCDDAQAEAARVKTEALTLGKTLRCRQVATSYRRIVADCTVEGASLSCAVLATGAGVAWPVYFKRYRMEPCR